MTPTALDALAVLSWLLLPQAALITAHRRLRRSGSQAIGAGTLAAGLAGVAAVAVAVLPSVADAAERTFAGHMAQHLLLGSIGPLLLVVGRTSELAPWVLAPSRRKELRRWAGTLLRPPRSVRGPTVAMVIVWFAWHVPALYDAAVVVPVLHLLEHGSYLVAGWCFWAAVAPHRRRTGAPVLALFALTVGVGLLGAFLSLSPVAFYDQVAATTEQARLEDQHLGGLLMWTPGGLVYLVAMIVQLVRWLGGHGLPDGTAVAPERRVAT